MTTLEDKRSKLKRYAKLRRLTPARAPKNPSEKGLDAAFDELAKSLKKSGELARVTFQVQGKRKTANWAVQLADDACKVSRKVPATSDLTVAISDDDAWSIVQGDVSPVEVFLTGRMLIQGNCALAKRLYRDLASRGETDLP